MKPRIRILLISAVWLGWVILVLLFIRSEDVDRSKIFEKSGLVASAECIESRSVRGIKFKVNYKGEKESRYDFINLAPDVACDEKLLKRFENSEIKILAYKNHYLEVNIDGFLLETLNESIGEVNDKSGSIYFLFFVAAVATFAIFFSGRHKRKES